MSGSTHSVFKSGEFARYCTLLHDAYYRGGFFSSADHSGNLFPSEFALAASCLADVTCSVGYCMMQRAVPKERRCSSSQAMSGSLEVAWE